MSKVEIYFEHPVEEETPYSNSLEELWQVVHLPLIEIHYLTDK